MNWQKLFHCVPNPKLQDGVPFFQFFLPPSPQNGELCGGSTVAAGQSRGPNRGDLRSAVRLCQVLQATGSPGQVSKETAEGNGVAATAGRRRAAALGD